MVRLETAVDHIPGNRMFLCILSVIIRLEVGLQPNIVVTLRRVLAVITIIIFVYYIISADMRNLIYIHKPTI